jgi:multidrug efflux pump subunit AcrB
VSGPVAWFARNPVAANLLMAAMLVLGVLALPSLPRKVFPDVDLGTIRVLVEFPGAPPEEVELGVCVRVEEAVQGLSGIQRVRSTASEGACTTFLELARGADLDRALADTKSRIDAVDTFPDESEEPVVTAMISRIRVADVAVSGPADYGTLARAAERLRDELAALPGITHVDVLEPRPREIAIEVSEAALRRHGLRFDDVARAVRQASFDLPGGRIEAEGAEILLRSRGQARAEREFAAVPVLARNDGARLLLGDVASVRDGYVDTDQQSFLDGAPAVLLQVMREGDQDAVGIAERVRAYLAEPPAWLPPGLRVTLTVDTTVTLRERAEILLSNGRSGFLLVLLVLATFLRPRVAFWVAFSVPTAILGGFALFPLFDFAIDPISIFAFILVLGILVDDAIVVGDSVYARQEAGEEPVEAAVAGTRRVSVDVVFGVLTTVAAFAALLAVPGGMGQILALIAAVVILSLLASLVESQLVLPAHLSQGLRMRPDRELLLVVTPVLLLLPPWLGAPAALLVAGALATRRWPAWSARIEGGRQRASRWLTRLGEVHYRRWLECALAFRGATLAGFGAALAVAVTLLATGRVPFAFFPPIEGDFVLASLSLAPGVPAERTAELARRLEAAAQRVRREIDAEEPAARGSIFRHTLLTLGAQPLRDRLGANAMGAPEVSRSGAHLAELVMTLVPGNEREARAEEIAARWRQAAGEIPEAIELSFASTVFSAGKAIDVRLHGQNLGELAAAASALRARLASFAGVLDVADSFRAGKPEVSLRLHPGVDALGVSFADLARQVRQAFHGEEVQRLQDGRDDVRVVVRYPERERRSLASLEALRIRTGDGVELPLAALAETRLERGLAAVAREERARVVSVSADVDLEAGDENAIATALAEHVLPELARAHPGVRWSFGGVQEEQGDAMRSLATAFGMALLAIYTLLAVPLRSYVQPLLVMSVIPFGLCGAVLGHLLVGRHISMMSMFGIISLAGVVVNSSLLLVTFVNEARAANRPIDEAICASGVARFRPIVLTTLTTFAGVFTLTLDRSAQAGFLIPAAVSLGYGVLASSVVTLFLVPCLYATAVDLRLALARDAARRASTTARPPFPEAA